MRIFKRFLSLTITCAVTLSAFTASFPVSFFSKNAEAASATVSIKLEPDAHSTFHDTNGDGYGEFQGFGTSLCWWANRCGYNSTLTTEAAKLLYNENTGLGMTIGRYNIGGGDDPTHNHITRSDSKMPGFWTTPTQINETEATNYAAYDPKSGYAWNYNWNADSNQLNVALACQKEAGAEFQAEAFSNSPPYFMTVSGCSSGSKDGASTNIKSNSYDAFATYFTDVVKHLKEENGLNITSMTGMNEPESSNWTANSEKQEGCHISEGKNQSKLITSIAKRAEELKLSESITLSASDCSSIYAAATSYKKLSSKAKKSIQRIDTHAYNDAYYMPNLRILAEKSNKNLWMSEMDGTATAGTNAGEMSAALGLSDYISTELNALQPSAWIMWDAIDIHIDASNTADAASITPEERIEKDTQGFWGVLIADHNQSNLIFTKKYYGFGQYSRYIRPGYTIIGANNNAVAAYDTQNNKLVVVAPNKKAKSTSCNIDLSQFDSIATTATVQAIRTSGTLAEGENWANVSETIKANLDTKKKKFSTTLKENSITTYIISGISLKDNWDTRKLKEISFGKKAISGKMPALEINAPKNIADQDYTTDYDCAKGWLKIDLKKKHTIQAISYSASSIDASKATGITVYGSKNGKKWKKLCVIGSVPSCYTDSYIWKSEFANSSKCRYLKLSKKNGRMALSEFSVYTNK